MAVGVKHKMLEKLNRGEHVVTYELAQVRPARKPVIGEIRYLMPLIPMPGEPLASMMLSNPLRIIYDGEKWQPVGWN